jgi:hypothetical protein
MFQGPRQIVDVTVRSPVSMSTRGTPRVVGGEKDNLSVLLYDTFDTEAVQNRILGTVGTSVTSAVFMSPPPPAPKVSRKVSVDAEDTSEGGWRSDVEVWAVLGNLDASSRLPASPMLTYADVC